MKVNTILLSILAFATPALAAPKLKRKRVFKVYTPQEIRGLEEINHDGRLLQKTKQPKPANTKQPKGPKMSMSMSMPTTMSMSMPLDGPMMSMPANSPMMNMPMDGPMMSMPANSPMMNMPMDSPMMSPMETSTPTYYPTASGDDAAVAVTTMPPSPAPMVQDVVETTTMPPTPAPMVLDGAAGTTVPSTPAPAPTDVTTNAPTMVGTPSVALSRTLSPSMVSVDVSSPTPPVPTLLPTFASTATGAEKTEPPTAANVTATASPSAEKTDFPTASPVELATTPEIAASAATAPAPETSSGAMTLGTTLAAMAVVCVMIFV